MNLYSTLHEVPQLLIDNKIGIIPTDTVYGLVGSALNPEVVERIFITKKRNEFKPLIILIASIEDIKKFKITLSNNQFKFLNIIWPGSVSVITACPLLQFEYLHRRTESLAFRIPDKPELLSLLSITGPLVAPSANIEGQPTVNTISIAQDIFTDTVDFYVDGGNITSFSSTLIKLESESAPTIIRDGAVSSNSIIQSYRESYKK